MFLNNIVRVEDILIHEEVVKASFSCDLEVCKGACCTIESEYGAPVTQSEVEEIGSVLNLVVKDLPDEHRKIIEEEGFFENKDGELLTRSFKRRACVFVYYEKDIAKCSLEKAFLEGRSSFRKPLSCHLFPIRISDFGGDVIRYEKFTECKPAVEKGNRESVNLIDFCKEPIIRKYGKNIYSKIKESTGK